jgi:hypothetical protein
LRWLRWLRLLRWPLWQCAQLAAAAADLFAPFLTWQARKLELNRIAMEKQKQHREAVVGEMAQSWSPGPLQPPSFLTQWLPSAWRES